MECKAIDDLSGARCTLEEDHDLPHRDLSCWEIQITFYDPVELIVPVPGTKITET